ncbi:TPA: DUF2971 domain-containing protein [Vibrio vulnificus]|nr:DUF2971 domain-containing protein [Vibrio vulnificus]
MKSARDLGVKKLYKYRAFEPSRTEFIKSIFEKSELYYPFPSGLNDPFECQFQLKVGDLSDLEYRSKHRVWAYEVQKHLSPVVGPVDYFKYYDSLSNETHLKFTKDIRDKTFETVDQKWGIFSLSSDPQNVLMWAHYANNHRGFCLEFDTSNDYFGRAWKVNYVNRINSIDILDFTEEDAFNSLVTKTKEWSYESEFRVISNAQNQVVGLPALVRENVSEFPVSKLSAIIFGARMSQADITEVLGWLDERHSHVKLKKIGLNSDGTLRVTGI